MKGAFPKGQFFCHLVYQPFQVFFYIFNYVVEKIISQHGQIYTTLQLCLFLLHPEGGPGSRLVMAWLTVAKCSGSQVNGTIFPLRERA